MKNQRSNISRATIYNTLELLENCGLLAKRNFGDNTKRYESNFKRKNHDHLICINCGAITEFSDQDVEKIVEKICTEMGFESAGYSFNIFGKCKNTQKCKKISHG